MNERYLKFIFREFNVSDSQKGKHFRTQIPTGTDDFGKLTACWEILSLSSLYWRM